MRINLLFLLLFVLLNVNIIIAIVNSNCIGEDCSIIEKPIITHVIPSHQNGGFVVIYGSFGLVRNNLSVTIGGYNCPIVSDYKDNIKCLSTGGYGTQKLSIHLNGITVSNDTIYTFKSDGLECPFDYKLMVGCNGACNYTTGECICFSGTSGLYCNLPNITISSAVQTISAIDDNGGRNHVLTFNGSFGYDPNSFNLSVYIGMDICSITSLESSRLSCIISKAVFPYSPIYIYGSYGNSPFYYSFDILIQKEFDCPNNCTYSAKFCNRAKGVCSCPKRSNRDYNPYDCSDKCSYGGCTKFIDSINDTTIRGGPFDINGWFDNNYWGINVTINGNINCPIISNSSTTITCLAPLIQSTSNSYPIEINFYTNDYREIVFSLEGSVNYKLTDCLNQCSGNGRCDEYSKCQCLPGFNGQDCSSYSFFPFSSSSSSQDKENYSFNIEFNPFVMILIFIFILITLITSKK